MIIRIRKNKVLDTPWMKVYNDDVLVNGNRSKYGYVKRSDFIMAVAKRGDKFLLVRQFRYPILCYTWELPQGAIHHDEKTSEALKRELFEETGAVVIQIKEIGKLYEAAGFASHICSVFSCQVTSQLGQDLDEAEEGLTWRWFAQDELLEMIQNNAIQDAPTIAGLTIGGIHEC